MTEEISLSLFNWDEFNQSENPAIELLKEMKYQYIEGEKLTQLSGERESLRSVILLEKVIKKIKEFNPWISVENIKQVTRILTIPTNPDLIESNEMIWTYLTKPATLCVEQDIGDGRGRRNQSVLLIDWEDVDKNEFLVTNQFKINSPKGNIKPDLVIFVNGIPLVVIECKSPLITNPMAEAIKQVMDYQEKAPKLFLTNQFIITICGQSARYGSITASFEHYKEWKDPYPATINALENLIASFNRTTPKPTPQDILLYGLLDRRNFLDIIRNFILFEKNREKTLKKIAMYQQFRAVNKTIDRILIEKVPTNRGGTVWHTQGSGKSITMIFTSIKLRREKSLGNPLLVFVTDRVDLIRQLNKVFNSCGFPNPVEARSAEDLQEKIKVGNGVTVFTTIQKFRVDDADEETGVSKSGKKYPQLTESKDVFVIVDEAHRSQYKMFATNMRTGIPNACFLAYTGTPLARNEKNELISAGRGKTVHKFGKFIDVYDIRQSVADNATLPILYEGRLPELRLEGESIDEIFDRVFADNTPAEREELKKKYATQKAILSAPERIKKIVLDIIKHYEETIQPNHYKAQIVVQSRELAIIYKKYMDEYNGPESAVIISPWRRDDQLKRIYGVPFITEKQAQADTIEQFLDKNDPLCFLIVCDMLITGFDAPIEQVMYLDKSLREHSLLQAIARVNRVYDENKTYGLIVDYYGISFHLQEALAIFDAKDIDGVMSPIAGEMPRLQQRHRFALSFFDRIDIDDLESCVLSLSEEEHRSEFYSAFKQFSQSMDVIMPDSRANPYIQDLKRLGMIVRAARNRYRDEHLNLIGCGEKVKKLIDDHIRSTGIRQLVESVPILSEKFDELLRELQSDEARASEIEHAIKHELVVKEDEDPVFYRSLKEKLEEIIEMYTQQRIDLAEKIRQLKAIVSDLKNRPNVAEELGLSSSEYAFFNLLKEGIFNDANIDDREIAKATYEILERLEKFITLIDWESKPDIIRQIRKECKETFQETPLPREQYDVLAHKIVDLAKVHYPSR